MRELPILKPLLRLEDAAVLDPIAEAVQQRVAALLRPRALEDVLHGTPIGHPLHPLLVLVPTGAWTSAAVLDVVPGMERAARLLVGVGVLAAVPAAIAGWADWARTHPQQMRVGLVHAASNAAAVTLYGWSFVARGRGRGRLSALLGLAAVSAGGYLGGHLGYRQAVGANHAEQVPHLFPEGWQPIGALDDLPDGRLARREVGGQAVLVLRRGDAVHALSDVCTHLAAPLDQGALTEEHGVACVTCPWHASVFDVTTGEVVHGPATAPQPRFDTRVADGEVAVRLP